MKHLTLDIWFLFQSNDNMFLINGIKNNYVYEGFGIISFPMNASGKHESNTN